MNDKLGKVVYGYAYVYGCAYVYGYAEILVENSIV